VGGAVDIRARVGAIVGRPEVLVSQTVDGTSSPPSRLEGGGGGEHELEGVADRRRLHRVVSG
jgi:hypothetical protein